MDHRRAEAAGVLAARWAFAAACLWPLLPRLARPGLYADDVPRLVELQTRPLAAHLLRPFNEHVAPLFELVSRLTWDAAGHRLASTPWAFTLASMAPWPLLLWQLHRVLRKATGSTTAARLGVALFATATVALETVYWYSASSFAWSLLAALTAWSAMNRLLDPGELPRSRRLAAALGVAAATAAGPAFSAIGLLAGPFAMVRALVDPASDRAGLRRRGLGLLAAGLGLALYLGLLWEVRSRDGLAPRKVDHDGLILGLTAAARAPAEVLVPSLVGLRWHPGTATAAAATGGLVVIVLLAAWRGGRRAWPLLLGGLALMAGGYVLTYVPRAVEMGPSLEKIQRYHLFPLLGLTFVATGLAAVAGRRALDALDARPLVGGWVAAFFALSLTIGHDGHRRGLAAFLYDADQAPTLRALDRLQRICLDRGITRDQAIAALDPVGNRWTPPGENALRLLGPAAARPSRPDAAARSTLLAALAADDRRALCGGMDATPYLAPDPAPAPGPDDPPRRLYRVRRDAAGGLVAEGWPSFAEFALASDGGAAAIVVPADVPRGWVEVWWARPGDRWSQTRSVRLDLTRAHPPAPGASWRLPLDRLPHWDHAADRVRLLFHAPGPLAAAAPRLVR